MRVLRLTEFFAAKPEEIPAFKLHVAATRTGSPIPRLDDAEIAPALCHPTSQVMGCLKLHLMFKKVSRIRQSLRLKSVRLDKRPDD